MLRAQHGDVAAFAELTAEKTGRLSAVARLILRDKDRTADVSRTRLTNLAS